MALAVSDGMQLSLANLESANLTGTTADDTVDVSAWTKSGRLKMNIGNDSLQVTKDQNLKLTSSILTATDGLSMTVSGFELIVLAGGDSANQIDAFSYKGAARLIGNGGNDVLMRGSGADTVLGGDGDDILLNNAGADLLDGGNGMDLLVGGNDMDMLMGGANGDILIGGRINYNNNLAAYDAIHAEWTSGGSYAERTANILSGLGVASPFKLGAATLRDDLAIDSLVGGGPELNDIDLDWFFHKIGSAAPDSIVDLEFGELDSGF